MPSKILKTNSKVFVTGGGGFLGGYVCQRLSEAGISYQAPDRREVDITDKEILAKALNGVGSIVHLAGNIRTSKTDTLEKHFRINTAGTLNVLEAARLNKVKKIIFASTVEVYYPLVQRQRVDENDPTIPFSYYGQSKLLAENLIKQYSQEFGISYVILRFGYLYGKGMRGDRLISKLISASKKDTDMALSVNNEFFLDMLYAEDAARVVVSSLNERVRNKILNVSSGRKTTVKNIVDIIRGINPNFSVKYANSRESAPCHYYDNKELLACLKIRKPSDFKGNIKKIYESI